ncbi:hypothetical protein SAMN05192588_0558 [Nonlabens sp. Hel1_33_55]|uniref:hypothetical protein n=1 Tax=Nonlabens sp. Hel1_33_55 TaxID=1336802 RepID=UPI000875E394|nr:hypothetical protein [Nonlabens sp. Hel1_33_55]SCX98105.1 hypothetical protein SAMN05192588_0558 [Nonlabens sp. Hel1_33_55]
MKTPQSNLKIANEQHTDIASIYFVENFAIVEIMANTILGKNGLTPILDAIENEYKDLSKVHYISNRTEVYCLKPVEIKELKDRIDLFRSYSVILYGKAGKTNLDFERMFLNKPIIKYHNLEEAILAGQVQDRGGFL